MNTTHLALRLPEIVNQIVSYLINIQDQENRKNYTNVYPCLFINSLWHDIASRHLWKYIIFEDSKSEYESFLKFISTATNTLPIRSCHLQTGHSQWITGASKSYSTNNSEADDVRVLSPNRDVPMDENESNAGCIHYNCYRSSIRSISLRKIKEKSINESLVEIAPYLQRLEKFDIYICDYLSDHTIQTFINYNAFSALTELSLAGCNRITDFSIINTAKICKNLLHLDLRACGQVSDNSICEIAKNCRKLQHLNVGRVRDRERITIRSIELIAKYTKVTVLGLAGCDMTDECLLLLAKHRGRSLERISVNNCHRLTNRTLKIYAESCPNLSVFEMKECHWIDDWESVAELVQRRVLLTLCDQQTKACSEWARRNGKVMHVRALQTPQIINV